MRDPNLEIKKIEEENLLRELKHGTQETGINFHFNDHKLINFCSNNYLGLCSHERIKTAAKKAVDSYGVGSGASRLVSGSSLPHLEVEKESAIFFEKESAIFFSNGYTAALGTLGAILQPDDIVIIDRLCHASLIDGAKLSGATLRSFPHNNLDKLETILDTTSKANNKNYRILIVTEGIFSMDCDSPDLSKILNLKKKYNALLLVDEAHSFGICGEIGKGKLSEYNLSEQADFIMATFGKSAGAAGAVTATSKIWRDLIINKARSFIYSTAPMPSQAAAASEGLKIIQEDEGNLRREKLDSNINLLCTKLNLKRPKGAILPIMVGEESDSIEISNKLFESGIYAPAIRYPTVARGSSRIRITLSADHTDKNITDLADILLSQKIIK